MSEQEPSFQAELQSLLNRYNQEGHSNTPDFLLAQFITGCVDAFNEVVKARDAWYGVELVPGRFVKQIGGERPILDCTHPRYGNTPYCGDILCSNYAGRFQQ